jgi:SAM-dependent methyltransferase
VDERRRLVAAGYDEVAGAYAALERAGLEWPRLSLLRSLLARLYQRSSILDLGGNGVPALREIVQLHRGVGVDISQTQIALARANVPNAELHQGDAMAVDFPSGSFDAVVAFYLLDHLPREEHASLFARLNDWLKPGGFLLFSIEPGDEPAYVGDWLGQPMFFSHFDEETTLGLVRDAGFDILESHTEVQTEGEKEVDFLWVLAIRPRSARP